jgi:multidrug resistance efflux pump
MSTAAPLRSPDGQAAVGTAGFADGASWDALADRADIKRFGAAWLDLQCRLIGDVRVAVLVLADPAGGELVPCCWWPPSATPAAEASAGASPDRRHPALTAVAELALERRRGAVRQLGAEADEPAARDVFAWPLLAGDAARGVVALEAEHQGDARMRHVMRLLQWGAAWWQAGRGDSGDLGAAAPADLTRVLGVLVGAMEEPSFEGAATAAVTELAVALDCDRVAYGCRSGRQVRVRALSHSADFNKKAGLLRDIAAAMDEAMDQQAMLVLPAPEQTPALGTAALGLASHAARKLAVAHGAGALCVVPLADAGRICAAISLERDAARPFTPAELALCNHAGTLLGPVLEAKRREQRWIGAKNWDALTGLLGRLLGPGHLPLKAAALGAAALIAFFALATGPYRINAPAVLEGAVQRAVTAPLDGFIASASVRPGDLVAAGDVLAALEDKDLQLEQAKWDAELAKLAREYSQAIAERDRAEMRILGARIDQAEARSALLAEQLARTTLTAPFAGVVVAGDLSQSIGAPVSRGDVLFELAPLADYRVVLSVDERDIARVAVDQRGRVALTGLPAAPLPIAVVKLTPVAQAEEGSNRFRVEARLLPDAAADQPATLAELRPGMRGIGKLDLGERNLFWIWTHRLQHWLRSQWWAWTG